MLTASYVSPLNANETLTRGNFYQLLKGRPHYIGLVGTMHPEYTLMYITQCLGNVVYTDKNKKPGSVTEIDDMSFAWDLKVNEIKRISFAEAVVGEYNGSDEIPMYFTESYYQKNDVFVIEGSRQQCRVIAKPERIAENCIKVCVRLVDPTYTLVLDTDACQKGMTTRWLYAPQPEMHYEGYCKYTSNIEKYKGYITRHRYEAHVSSEFALKEDVILKLSKGEGNNNGELLYSMDSVQDQLLNTTLAGMNTANLLAKTNVDANGHVTDLDTTGQPIIIGDGLIPQIERYASKFVYNDHITWTAIQRMLHALNEKKDSYVGNKYLFLCNNAMWQDIQTMALRTAYDWKECQTSSMWSKASDGFMKLGSTFSTFEIEGNEVTFKVDKALTIEYGEKGFGLLMDVDHDVVKGRPAIETFSLMNKEFITNYIPGVGGKDGKTAGEVASPVAATTYINWGYTGIGCYAPFMNAIIMQA